MIENGSQSSVHVRESSSLFHEVWRHQPFLSQVDVGQNWEWKWSSRDLSGCGTLLIDRWGLSTARYLYSVPPRTLSFLPLCIRILSFYQSRWEPSLLFPLLQYLCSCLVPSFLYFLEFGPLQCPILSNTGLTVHTLDKQFSSPPAPASPYKGNHG